MKSLADGRDEARPSPDWSEGGPRYLVAGLHAGRDEARPSRKAPAHLPILEQGNRSPIVFLTVCAQDRQKFFVRPEAHTLLVEAWTSAAAWKVGRYIIMPDHIHLFCSPSLRDGPSLTKWV